MESFFTERYLKRSDAIDFTRRQVVGGDELRGVTLVLDRGFYVVLVTNGTARFSDNDRSMRLRSGDLLVLTPSMRGRFGDAEPGFRMECIHICPDYFDTLTDGQPMYHQLAKYIGKEQIPLFHLDRDTRLFLQRSMALFRDPLYGFKFYREGVVRHFHSFFLLQISDILCRNTPAATVCIKRSNEIFRGFKALLVHHYQTHHDLGFYADRLHVSTTYLSRIVKRMTGHTVRYHLTELLRVEAFMLLYNTDLDIKEIADRLGFADQSVFGKFFVRETGISPMKYRTKRLAADR